MFGFKKKREAQKAENEAKMKEPFNEVERKAKSEQLAKFCGIQFNQVDRTKQLVIMILDKPEMFKANDNPTFKELVQYYASGDVDNKMEEIGKRIQLLQNMAEYMEIMQDAVKIGSMALDHFSWLNARVNYKK